MAQIRRPHMRTHTLPLLPATQTSPGSKDWTAIATAISPTLSDALVAGAARARPVSQRTLKKGEKLRRSAEGRRMVMTSLLLSELDLRGGHQARRGSRRGIVGRGAGAQQQQQQQQQRVAPQSSRATCQGESRCDLGRLVGCTGAS